VGLIRVADYDDDDDDGDADADDGDNDLLRTAFFVVVLGAFGFFHISERVLSFF
jgi:hypothetical protein